LPTRHGCEYPNPNVAAAIYGPAGDLIADGFHNRKASLDHAEIVAIKRAGGKVRGATIVVSLEPCAHVGSTPPCTQAIIDAGISRVIFAVKDPNPIAAGGEEVLKRAGIAVEYQPSAQLSFAQRAWLHKAKSSRPLMVWKVAVTLDGKMAALDGTSQWISNEGSRHDVQLLRAQSDAILIGTQTAIIDNPHLIPRGFDARPVRVVCGQQTIPPTHHLFDEEARTIVVPTKDLSQLQEVLRDEGFNQVLVEAGPTFGTALLKTNLIDEIVMYQAPKLLGSGKEFLEDLGITTLENHIALELISTENINGDVKTHYVVKGH